MSTPIDESVVSSDERAAPPAMPLGNCVRDDYSGAFHKMRSRLVDERGCRYVEYIRGLQPDFNRVYRDIAFGYMMLIATACLVVYLVRIGMPTAAAIAIGSVFFGYWIAYLQLFIHEAAHFNLAADRRLSDRLGNLLIAWMVGTNVARYRKVHFEHHRALGTTEDTEWTYFLPLNAAFVFKSLLGIRAAEVLLGRRQYLRTGRNQDNIALSTVGSPRGTHAQCGTAPISAVASTAAGILAHLVVIAVALAIGSWPLAAAWVVGVGMVFPFLAALRPLLEHRDEAASNAVDYRRVNHGAYTRLFGDGPLSATFGAAGFNRHLLHHWEPQVSYTRLPELEGFLVRTAMKPIMESRRTSYDAALRRLFTLY